MAHGEDTGRSTSARPCRVRACPRALALRGSDKATILITALCLAALVWSLRAGLAPVPRGHLLASAGVPLDEARLVYFYAMGCTDCADSAQAIRVAIARQAGLKIALVSADDPQAATLRERLNGRYSVRARDAAEIPALFGAQAHIGPGSVLSALPLEVAQAASAPPLLSSVEAEPGAGSSALPLTWLALGGLLDGCSPCAAATMALFGSWVLLRRPCLRGVLAALSLFGLGLAAVYTLAGIGFYAVLARTMASAVARAAGQLTTAVVVLALAAVLLEDANRARLGCLADLVVKTPTVGREASRLVLRWAGRSRLRAGALLVAGAAVGGLELACTGVVYLPMLASLASAGAPRAYVAAALAIHNAAFLAPLAAAALVTWTAARRAQPWLLMPRNVMVARLATAALLVLLGAWMTWTAAGVVGT